MNNHTTASLFAAALLAALSACAATPASAQSDTTTGVSLAGFTSQYNIPVVQDSTPVAAQSSDNAEPNARLQELQRLAADSGTTWRKLYQVSPATAGQPVTTLASASQMADQAGPVAVSIRGVPAAIALKTVAAADGAMVKLTGAIAANAASVTLSSSSVPQAIADIAQKTQTHWAAVYVLAPIESGAPAERRAASLDASLLSQEQIEKTLLNNGPYTMHFAPLPPASAAPAPGAPPAAQSAQRGRGPRPMGTPGRAQNANPNVRPDPNASNSTVNPDPDDDNAVN